MQNLRDHKAAIVEIANAIGHYTLDFSAEPYKRILDKLEEIISPGCANALQVDALVGELYNHCLHACPPPRQGEFGYFYQGEFGYFYKNRNLSLTADNLIQTFFRSSSMFLIRERGLHGQFTAAIFELLRLIMTTKIVNQFTNTAFVVQDGQPNYADSLVTKSYADLVSEQTLRRITEQARGVHGRTIISAFAKFVDTADPQLVAAKNIVIDKEETLGLGVSGYVIFDQPTPGRDKYTRSGAVVLQTCIDHGSLEENEMFLAMNQMFDECVGDDYPALANSRQIRAASALKLVMKLMA